VNRRVPPGCGSGCRRRHPAGHRRRVPGRPHGGPPHPVRRPGRLLLVSDWSPSCCRTSPGRNWPPA